MKVAVVGATGLVGTRMLEVLAERNFPVTGLYPVASSKSVGRKITYKGKEYPVVYFGSDTTGEKAYEEFYGKCGRCHSGTP